MKILKFFKGKKVKVKVQGISKWRPGEYRENLDQWGNEKVSEEDDKLSAYNYQMNHIQDKVKYAIEFGNWINNEEILDFYITSNVIEKYRKKLIKDSNL